MVYGSYELRRVTVDVDQTALSGKLGVRLNGVLSDTHGYQHFALNEERLRGFSAGLTAVGRQQQLAYYYVDIADGNKRKTKYLPEQLNTNLMLSYRFKLGSRHQWTTQANVTNLLNHRDLVFIRNVGSGVVENARMNAVPCAWSWTNTLEF